MPLNVKDCRQSNTACFLGSDDSAYNCVDKIFTEKEWNDFRKKTNPKRIVIHNVTQDDKGWLVSHVVLPPNVALLSDIGDKATQAEAGEHYTKSPYAPKQAGATLQDLPVIDCCNEWVAITRVEIDTGSIIIPEQANVGTQEAYVIGVGPGVAVNGTRVPSQLKHGDKIFYSGAIAHTLQITDNNGKRVEVLFISERNVVCKS